MKTTGPILAIGAITLINRSVLHGQAIDWRVPLATAAAAAIFAGAELVWEPGATGIAYVALVSTLFVPLDPAVPAPAASFAAWWGQLGGASTAGTAGTRSTTIAV